MKKTELRVIQRAFLCFIAVAALGCPGKNEPTVPPTDATSASEIAAAVIGGVVNATSATGVSASYRPRKERPMWAKLLNKINFFPEAMAQLPPPVFGNCPNIWGTGGGALSCTNPNSSQVYFPYVYCDQSDATISWAGSQLIRMTQGTTSLTCNVGFPAFQANDTIIRSFGNATVRAFAATGILVLLETSSISNGWATPVLTTGETVVFTGTGARTVTVNGLHVALDVGSYIIWDDVITSPPIFVSATDGVATGQITNQLNKTNDIAISTLTGLVFSGCCYPVGGTITTTYNGDPTGARNETLTFPSCGVGILNGNQITLHHCY